MMLAVFIAKLVGDSMGMGIYDLHIKIRGAPVLVTPPAACHMLQHCGCLMLMHQCKPWVGIAQT